MDKLRGLPTADDEMITDVAGVDQVRELLQDPSKIHQHSKEVDKFKDRLRQLSQKCKNAKTNIREK